MSRSGGRTLVTIDARMLQASGIGTCLRSLLPRVFSRLPDVRFCLLGDISALREQSFGGDPRVELRAFSVGVYSALEQPGLTARIPRDTRLFWAPHINLPLLSPGKLLVTVHDAFYLNPPPEAVPRLDKRLYLGLLMRALPRRADAVLCVSDFTRRELLARLGPFRSPVHTVLNGVEPSWFEPPRCHAPQAKPYLLYVGNLKPHKNVPRMLAAFERIAADVPHDFILIGGGANTFSRQLPPHIAPRVRFLGATSNEVLRCHVAHASGLVLASLYEGFGLPPVEAMALGVPVLVSRAASLPEVCADAALYCDPLDENDIAHGLRTLLGDEALRARLRERGPARARELDWEQSADRVSEVIAGLL
jgi:glycosyltransferase involved in cell wall biosynthesis